MSIDRKKLQRVCEDVLMEYVGPAGFIVASDAIAKCNFLNSMPGASQLGAFAVVLKSEIPSDLPRDHIVKLVLDAYNAG